MKAGLYLVHTSLLTISVLSSCALFILVVSEASLPTESNASDSAGLSNVTKLNKEETKAGDATRAKEKKPRPPDEVPVVQKPPIFAESEQTFAEALSQNSVISNGLPDTGQPPILLSLADTMKLELQDAEKQSMFGNNSDQHNDTQPLVKTESVKNEQIEKEPSTEAGKAEKEVPETLVVQAKPMHEVKLAEEALMPPTSAPTVEEGEIEKENKTEAENVPKEETPHEDIPSFSEWAQKQLAEAEKQDTVLNHSSQPSHSNTNINNKSTKLGSKNYASPACGAKVVAVNPEAGSASSILSPNKDEYMLNTCNSRIWFIVELCEPIQAQKIEIANFELFSSSPKDFAVYFSDRYPTRDWTSVGQFEAKYDKEVQSFDLFPHLFGKFIKVEMLSHYGSEHYCPISLFKVYGTSEFEVLEKENSQHPDADLDDDDDEILGDLPDAVATDAETTKNVFGSARDAVMSIMKKAAQVLVKSESPKNITAQAGKNETSEMYQKCCTPSHIIVCDNCSKALYDDVYDLISCNSHKLMIAINQVFIHETLRNTDICQKYGLDFRNKRTISFRNERAYYMNAVFSENYIAALCNFLAIIDKKVVLNTSYETEMNVTTNLTLDKVSNTVVDESNFHEVVQIPFKDKLQNDKDSLANAENKVPIVPDSLVVKEKEESKDKSSEPPQDILEPARENKSAIEPTVEKVVEKEKVDDSNFKDTILNDNFVPPVTEKPEEIPETGVHVDSCNNAKTEGASNVNVDPPIQEKAQSTNGAVDRTQNVNTPPPPTQAEEVLDQLAMDTESFISDFEQLITDPAAQTTASPNVPNQGQPPQKESVFLRLSNRVKTLERNMSLSGQYLEELSRRYKKQVEEMQKSFEKTVLQMTEERKRTEERDQANLEQTLKMQDQIAHLSAAVLILVEERDSWFGNMTFLKFVFFQAIILAIVLYYIKKRPTVDVKPATVRKTSKSRKNQEKRSRRKSVEGVSGHEKPAGKKRRPSEEALQIECQSAESLNVDEGEWQVAGRNRRRKTSTVFRPPVCNPAGPDWMRQDSICALRENIIPLDDAEFIAPVSEPTEFVGSTLPPKPKKEFPKTNGSILNNIKGTAKAVKNRRLSSPAFFRSALSRQSSRSTPSPVVSRTNNVVDLDKNGSRATSESPSGSLRSEPCFVPLQENGSCASETASLKKSKRRSFKSMFKKVF